MDGFGHSAQKLAKNPLGIIALFILLIYGIAGLVLGTSGTHLESSQKTILVWFFALFPFAVLFSFVWLVSKHHAKLYSPSDFRNDEGFLRALTPEEQRKRLEYEALEYISEEHSQTVTKGTSSDSKGKATPPSVPQLSQAKENILLMEELAVRELESVFSVSINRQVSLGADFGVDGMFLKDGDPHLVEIKYYGGRINLITIEKQLQALSIKGLRLHWKRLKIVFVMIIDEQLMRTAENFQRQFGNLSKKDGIEIIFIPIGENELKNKYGVQNSQLGARSNPH